MSDTVRDLISDAYQEFNQVGVGEAMPANLAVVGLNRFNRLVDQWNAIRPAIWADTFLDFTLVPDLSPHTIGPDSATFAVDVRPVNLQGASVVLNTSDPPVNVPIVLRDAQWWSYQAVQALTSTLPTDLYYQPDFPNGQLFFWPVPTIAYGVQLWTRALFSQGELDTALSYPPGYREALTATLAERLAATIGQPIPAELTERARMARQVIFANNLQTPRLRTRDSGMPRGRSAGWNWLTNTPSSYPEGR